VKGQYDMVLQECVGIFPKPKVRRNTTQECSTSPYCPPIRVKICYIILHCIKTVCAIDSKVHKLESTNWFYCQFRFLVRTSIKLPSNLCT